ncbi:alpha/beta hydrolase [Dysgonomonas gadei]|uniref:alpha/beta hydrolase n=1 Tax=Dysgonomonas gadei TaxID=156974 RepID=UPI003AEFEA9E
MKKLFTTLTLLVAITCLPLFSQTVDTIQVFSPKMNKTIKNVVVLPEGYDKSNPAKYPVLYLLHGYGGRYDTWVNGTKKSLPQDATRWQMIVVCPDGQNSWYWDSPVDPSMQFETYVSSELIKYIDEHYNTVASPKGRAVTGFSMGGHGGLWLGINHSDVFGACGSMSGGVDIRPFPNNWEMKSWLGKYKENEEQWNKHTVIDQLYKIEPNSLAIIIDCGVNDFFYNVNEELHKKMLYMNIPHDYIVRPGAHTHDYWNNAVDYQMMFFSKFFGRK